MDGATQYITTLYKLDSKGGGGVKQTSSEMAYSIPYLSLPLLVLFPHFEIYT